MTLPKHVPKTTFDGWQKSSYSDNGGNCIEVALGAVVGVRDTKDRDGGQLAITGQAWRSALARFQQD